MLPAARSFSILVVLLTLIGCVTPLPRPTTTYGDVEARMPPIPDGDGRFFFFTLDTMTSAEVDPIQLNGESVAPLQHSWIFFFVDQPAGNYEVLSPIGLGTSGKLMVDLVAGETAYIEWFYDNGMWGLKTIRLVPMDPRDMWQFIDKLYYAGPPL